MKYTAVIDGHRYTWLESLKMIGCEDEIVICQSESGAKLACHSDVWETHEENAMFSFSDAKVKNKSSSSEKISLFCSLFCGRGDVYAKRWYNLKTGQTGYSPACKNEWQRGICDKRATPCGRCPNRAFLPLTGSVIYRHLEGKDEYARDVVGLFPMLQDETTCILAIDFDDEGWQKDVSAFLGTCRDFGLTPAVERSRSGNGGHVWFFFSEPVEAAKARKLGSGLLSRAMERHATLKMESYDRLFPNQDTLPKGGFGNLIALPLQGMARRAGNSVFVNDHFDPWPDQWAFLSCVKRLTPEQLDELISTICHSGELGELANSGEDETPWKHSKPAELGRTDFPDSVELTLADGIYIKKEGMSNAALNRIKRLAAFRNPEFYKSQAMRLPTYNKPRVIDTSEDLPQYLKIPRGCMDALTEMLPKYIVSDKRNSGHSIDVVFNGELHLNKSRPLTRC